MEQIKNSDLQTPCFVFEEDVFAESVKQWNAAFTPYFKDVVIGYSVKTNPLPYAFKYAKALGCYAEVVSHDEYELAQLIGYPIEHIIYNGPMKSKETFIEAVKGGAVVNIETHRELDWLSELPKDERYSVGIRVNVNIEEISPDDAKGHVSFSRFGFNDQTGELADALTKIEKLRNVTLNGLHFHRTSLTRSVNFYKHLTQYACDIIKKYQLSLDYIDMGGGFFGVFKTAPTFEEYADAIVSTMKSNDISTNISLILEPGNGLFANAFYYITSVVDTKELPECRIVTTNGSRNDIDPFFSKSRYLSEVLYQQTTMPIVPRQIITGATCLEYDQLFELKDAPALQVGDRVRYNNVGAYTLCLTPLFINYFPIVYALKDGQYKVVREKWTANEFIQKSHI
jgi:diaminopimelate decarboxylase